MSEGAEGGGKSALTSKTVHFNWISAIAVPAVWPLLPESFRQKDYAISAVSAWFAIANIGLRFVSTEALTIWSKSHDRKVD